MLELKEHQKKYSVCVRIGPIPPGFQTTLLAVSTIELNNIIHVTKI